MPIARWSEAPQPAGVVVTNPPYGERISAPDMDALYETIGSKLKHVFTGYHAWIIGYRDEYFRKIGLAPSQRIPLFNGSLECELREYVIFDGDRKSFVAARCMSRLPAKATVRLASVRPKKAIVASIAARNKVLENGRLTKSRLRSDRSKNDRSRNVISQSASLRSPCRMPNRKIRCRYAAIRMP